MTQGLARCPGLSMGYVDYKPVLFIACLTCQRRFDTDRNLPPIKPPSFYDNWDVCPSYIAKESKK
jgi:hypothetical protein